jgi:hypothetical protein
MMAGMRIQGNASEEGKGTREEKVRMTGSVD